MCCRYYVESSERTRELVEQMPPSLRSCWKSIRFIHDRMPLILPEEYIDDWIKPDSVPEDIIGNAITDPFFEKYNGGIEPVEQLSFL